MHTRWKTRLCRLRQGRSQHGWHACRLRRRCRRCVTKGGWAAYTRLSLSYLHHGWHACIAAAAWAFFFHRMLSPPYGSQILVALSLQITNPNCRHLTAFYVTLCEIECLTTSFGLAFSVRKHECFTTRKTLRLQSSTLAT